MLGLLAELTSAQTRVHEDEICVTKAPRSPTRDSKEATTWWKRRITPSESGFVVTFRDVTESHLVKIANERLQLAVRASGTGIWEMNFRSGIFVWDPEMFEIYQRNPNSFGGTLKEWLAYLHSDDVARVAREWHTAATETSLFDCDFRIQWPSGEIRHISALARVDRDESGKPVRALGTNWDVTERRHLESALLEEKERLGLATGAGQIGVWEFDFRRGLFLWDARMHEIHGGAPGNYCFGVEPGRYGGTLQEWLEYVHPNDVQTILAIGESVAAGAPSFEAEYRIHRKSGELREVRCRGSITRDQSGVAIRATAATWDITEQKRITQELAAETERLRITLHSIGEAVICTDADATITFMNPIAEQLTGWHLEEAHGSPLEQVFELINERTGLPRSNVAAECLENKRARVADESSILVGRNGARLHIQASAALVQDASGTVMGTVLIFQDVTKSRTMQRQLEYSAMHDALTTLNNRHGFDKHFFDVCQKVSLAPETSSILCLIDLDRFKLVNDSAGHAAGDALLRDIGRLIRDCFRVDDFAARLGGDEFGILLEGCSIADANALASRLVTTIGQFEFIWDRKRYHVGASVGITRIVPAETMTDVLNNGVPDSRVASLVRKTMADADRACYEAKAAGRGLVVISSNNA